MGFPDPVKNARGTAGDVHSADKMLDDLCQFRLPGGEAEHIGKNITHVPGCGVQRDSYGPNIWSKLCTASWIVNEIRLAQRKNIGKLRTASNLTST